MKWSIWRLHSENMDVNDEWKQTRENPASLSVLLLCHRGQPMDVLLPAGRTMHGILVRQEQEQKRSNLVSATSFKWFWFLPSPTAAHSSKVRAKDFKGTSKAHSIHSHICFLPLYTFIINIINILQLHMRSLNTMCSCTFNSVQGTRGTYGLRLVFRLGRRPVPPVPPRGSIYRRSFANPGGTDTAGGPPGTLVIWWTAGNITW